MIFKRKLTEKSLMKFGQFADTTVQQLIDIHKVRYLRWVYYNCSQIDFCETVLDTLRIDEEWRINKPGTDPDMYHELNEYRIDATGGMTKLKAKSKLFKKKRIAKFKLDSAGRRVESRGVMQARNHGRR